MTTMTTTTDKRVKGVGRRAESLSKAAGTIPSDRRFVMVGHLVRVLSTYDSLDGKYAKVTGPDRGCGKVEVELTDWLGNVRRICYLSREVEIVPGGDYMRHRADELLLLIERSARLCALARRAAPELAAKMLKRAEALDVHIRAIQRVSATRLARWWMLEKGNTSCCLALVPYVAMESGVGA